MALEDNMLFHHRGFMGPPRANKIAIRVDYNKKNLKKN